MHDWGSALGFAWAHRHPDRVKAIAYMEGIVRPFLSWDEWPESTREFFKAQRTPGGEDLILQKNLFIEFLLPLRGLSKEAIEVYRRHYRNPGPARKPMLEWTRELPIEGRPRDVVQIVDAYAPRCPSTAGFVRSRRSSATLFRSLPDSLRDIVGHAEDLGRLALEQQMIVAKVTAR